MDVLALLDKLDAYLSECSRLPLVGRLLVDEDEVFTIIDDLRAAMPQELEQAKWLLKERERILQEARKESMDIIKDAQGQIASLASESVIAKEARAQADELLARARDVAKEINLGAREYADDVMRRVEEVLSEVLQRVGEGRRELALDREPPAPRPLDEDGLGEDAGYADENQGAIEVDLVRDEPSQSTRKRRWGRAD